MPASSSARSLALQSLVLGLGALALLHCNGSVDAGTGVGEDGGGAIGRASDGGAVPANDATPDAFPSLGDDASSDASPFESDGALNVQCTGQPTQPVPRPTCTATSNPAPPDGSSPPSCTTVADCADAGGSYNGCLAGKCTFDQCVADTDCPTGQACGCASEFGGNAFHMNRCVASECRTPADCASGGTCSPSNGSYCSSLTGFYCHSSADECATDTDCKCNVATFGEEPGQCAYAPQLGHFVCQLHVVCSG